MRFKDLPLSPFIQQALLELEITEPTEIQLKAIPVLMENPKIDFHGQAQTGTGKTFAFGIPLLHRLDQTLNIPQSLIVAPTRELALQIKESLSRLARHMQIRIEVIYGGVSMDDQIRALKRGAHIIVGTPGRLNDHLRRRTLQLNGIKTLVLDEADIMLDMGFKEEVDEILSYVPDNREIWLFSATVKSGMSELMNTHMKNPISVRVSRQQVTGATTKQHFCVIPGHARLHALTRFIESASEFYGFIFCQTKILTSEVAEYLLKKGYNVGALHGDMSQVQRNIVIKRFKQQDLSIVVATDVAARGIDIANLTHVVNYSLPDDQESYVHRIGRTGRAGKEGIAITFISRNEIRIVQHMQSKFNLMMTPIDVPSQSVIIASRLEQATKYMAESFESHETYTKPLEALVASLDEASIRSTVVRLLHDKFMKSLEQEDVNFTPSAKIVMPDNVKEVYLTVGSDDGVDRDQVVSFLVQTGHVTEEQIMKLRVIKRRTFVELPKESAHAVINSTHNQILGGRRVRVSLVEQLDQQPQQRYSRPRRY